MLCSLPRLQRQAEHREHAAHQQPRAVVHAHSDRSIIARLARRGAAGARARATAIAAVAVTVVTARGAGAAGRRGRSRRRRRSGARCRRATAAAARTGTSVAVAARHGLAGGLALEVVGVVGGAVLAPALTDVGGDRVGVVGDVGLIAVGAGAGPVEGGLFNLSCQRPFHIHNTDHARE